MRTISPRKYAVSLYELLQEVNKEKTPHVIRSFVALLVRHKALPKANKIMRALADYFDAQEGRAEVSVASVAPLDARLKERITQELKSTLRKTIELKEKTDKDLIGGLVLKYGDTVIDGSVRRRIELLVDSLK